MKIVFNIFFKLRKIPFFSYNLINWHWIKKNMPKQIITRNQPSRMCKEKCICSNIKKSKKIKNKKIELFTRSTGDMRNINDIFKYIKINYDTKTHEISVQIVKLMKKLTTAIQHKKFLLTCRTKDLIPKHIQNFVSKLNNFSLSSNSVKKKFKFLSKNISRKILNYIIQDLHFNINFIEKNLKPLKSILKYNLNPTLLIKYFFFEKNKNRYNN